LLLQKVHGLKFSFKSTTRFKASRQSTSIGKKTKSMCRLGRAGEWNTITKALVLWENIRPQAWDQRVLQSLNLFARIVFLERFFSIGQRTSIILNKHFGSVWHK
jgi:hypothetical protein